MNIPINTTFLVSQSGFFDFDLTFLIEALFFLLLACATTFFFIRPISNILELRATSIELNIKKSALLIFLGSENLSVILAILLEEIQEMNRQRDVAIESLEACLNKEIKFVENSNLSLLKNLQGNLFIKSAHAFSLVSEEISLSANNYFTARPNLLSEPFHEFSTK